jgi:hypothetical protein
MSGNGDGVGDDEDYDDHDDLDDLDDDADVWRGNRR